MKEPILEQLQNEWHGTLSDYVLGFIFSLLLTSVSFFLVIQRPFSKDIVIYTVIGLSFLQAIIQILFFLHVGKEKKPYLETMTLVFTALILIIIVAGSIWVMTDLNNRMMPEMHTMKGMTHD